MFLKVPQSSLGILRVPQLPYNMKASPSVSVDFHDFPQLSHRFDKKDDEEIP